MNKSVDLEIIQKKGMKAMKQMKKMSYQMFFCLCAVLMLAMMSATKIEAKATGDKKLFRLSKCTQTFTGKKDLVIRWNPSYGKNLIFWYYEDGADGSFFIGSRKKDGDPEWVKSIDVKKGEIVIKKEKLISYYCALDTRFRGKPVYKGTILFGLSISKGENGHFGLVDINYDLTSLKNKKYTLTFDTQGGKAIRSRKCKLYQKVKWPTPQRKGYTFLGWYDKKKGGSKIWDDYYVFNGNKTVYARWKKKK